jgi:hypothetical protein
MLCQYCMCGLPCQIWKLFLVKPREVTTLTVSLHQLAMSRYPSHLSPNITPTKSGKAQKSRARREPSGVFSLFQPQQIQQFKEAFSLIDQDRDGLVGEQDLKDTFTSLGVNSKPSGASEHGVLTPLHLRNCAVPRHDGRATHITPGGTWPTADFYRRPA